MFIRAYLRASTKEQNASRAKEVLSEFAKLNNVTIAAYYIENESGSKLERPELQRLLSDCSKGDIILVEQIDRLSRLNAGNWEQLKTAIKEAGVSVVSLDLPTSHTALNQTNSSEFMESILTAINSMLLDILAATAHKDYEDRRRRQAQGIKNNKEKFKGKQINKELHKKIKDLLDADMTYSQITGILGCSRATIARAKKLPANLE